MVMSNQYVYQFGPFRLDPAERQLLREGQPVQLTAKLFDILLLLVQNSGHLISKEDLMERIWPDSFVEINNLTVSMSALRKALGEAGQGVRYIETVSGHGYRFTANVQRVEENKLRAAPDASSPAPLKSIAVLPFQTADEGADNDYFGLGIADTLITKFSNIKQIVVISLGTILKYVKLEEDPLIVGRNLGVDAVLHGRIQKEGDKIRVTVQLVAAPDGKLLWAEKFDQKFRSIFAVQDSIAEQTARALTLTLTGRERDLLFKRDTDNSEAYQAYVKGRYFWNKRSEESIERGISYFQKAIEEDKNYAPAYVGLADCYNLLVTYGVVPPEEFIARIKTLIEKALGLDATLAEAYTTLGYIKLFHDWDWPGADREFKKAIELNPNYALARHWYAMYLMVTDQFEEALKEMKRAQSLDPLSPIISASLGGYYYYARKYQQAIRQCRETLEIDPNFYLGHGILGAVYAQIGEYEEAAQELKKAVSLSKDPEAYAALGYTYARWNRRDEAQALVKEIKDVSRQKHTTPFGISLVHVGLGEFDEAFQWLERAYQDRNPWLIWVGADPRLDPLRADPRFVELARRVGIAVSSAKPETATDSLAVLPFLNSTGDPSLEYLAQGISESIINNLSHLSSLKVMARSTVVRYQGQEADPLRIGQVLGVNALVAGKLFKVADNLIIGVEMINTSDGTQMWGEQYNRKVSDIFTAQGEIAQEISHKLCIKLNGRERAGLSKRYTESTEAYQLYLKGHYICAKYANHYVRRAIKLFRQAIKLDPSYAPAYAGLANSYFRLSNAFLSPLKAMPKARAAAARALEIDDHLAEGHLVMGLVKMYYERDWSGAEQEFQRAIELDPGAAGIRHRYGWFLVAAKRFKEGLAEIRLAQRLDPLAPLPDIELGFYYNITRQHDLAVKHYSKVIELEPNHYAARVGLGWAYTHLKELKKAVAELRKGFQLGADHLALGFMGYAQAVFGKRELAEKLLTRLIKASERTYVSPYNMTIIYAGLDEKDEAFYWLEKLYEERNEWLAWLNLSPELDGLRSDSRFADLLQRVGVPQTDLGS
jgi:TolB-like protein/Tfp pilus assembly protein PilF